MASDFPTPMPPSIFAQLDPRLPMLSWETALGPMVAAALGAPRCIPVPILRHSSCFRIFSLFVQEPSIPLVGSLIHGDSKRLRDNGHLSKSVIYAQGQPHRVDFVETKLQCSSSFFMEGQRGNITKGFHLILDEPTKFTLSSDTPIRFNADSISENDRNEVLYFVSEVIRARSLSLKMYHSDKEIFETPAYNSGDCEVNQWAHGWPLTVAVKLTQLCFDPITELLQEVDDPVAYDPDHVTWSMPNHWQTGFDSIHQRFLPYDVQTCSGPLL